MNRIILILFSVLCLSICGYTQTSKFALIQTVDNKPFFVKLPNIAKPISSTATGYLILPKLIGTQTLNIGFLGINETFDFVIDASTADKGFLLKNTEEKGWALFNWQNLEYVYQQGNTTPKVNVAAENNNIKKEENNTLGQMLNKVTGDNDIVIKEDRPILKPKAIDVPPVVKVDKPIPVNKEPEVAIKETLPTQPPIKMEPIKAPEKEIAIGILLVEEKTSEMGYNANYKIVNEDSTTDLVTVKILPKILKGLEEEAKPMVTREDAKPLTVDSTITTKTLEDAKPKMELPIVKVDEIKKVEPDIIAPIVATKVDSIKPTATPLVMINTDCNTKEQANDGDVEDLFAKMAVEKDLDEKLALAKKTFKKKCFSAAQIRNLSGSFFNDKNKYELFYTAFPYVNDTDNFKKLETILTDTYYINMFRTMVNK